MKTKYRWIIEILEDMSTFAKNEGLLALNESLEETLRTGARELRTVAEISERSVFNISTRRTDLGFEQKRISGSSKPIWSEDEQEIWNIKRRF